LKERPAILAALVKLGIALVTSPNYSVLTDVPRTDNLHAMKRGARSTRAAAKGIAYADMYILDLHIDTIRVKTRGFR
jgi:hypothetical protein